MEILGHIYLVWLLLVCMSMFINVVIAFKIGESEGGAEHEGNENLRQGLQAQER